MVYWVEKNTELNKSRLLTKTDGHDIQAKQMPVDSLPAHCLLVQSRVLLLCSADGVDLLGVGRLGIQHLLDELARLD